MIGIARIIPGAISKSFVTHILGIYHFLSLIKEITIGKNILKSARVHPIKKFYHMVGIDICLNSIGGEFSQHT